MIYTDPTLAEYAHQKIRCPQILTFTSKWHGSASPVHLRTCNRANPSIGYRADRAQDLEFAGDGWQWRAVSADLVRVVALISIQNPKHAAD